MAHAYRKDGVSRIHIESARAMREKVIAIQQHFAQFPSAYQEHPDVADAVKKAQWLRGALEKLM